MGDMKKAFLMEPYLQLGRSTLSPFIFARDGSIGPRRSRPICSSQFPPTSGGLMKRQTHHMEITRVAHIVLCQVPTHTNSMSSVLELKRSRTDTCLLCINCGRRLPFEFKDGSIGLRQARPIWSSQLPHVDLATFLLLSRAEICHIFCVAFLENLRRQKVILTLTDL